VTLLHEVTIALYYNFNTTLISIHLVVHSTYESPSIFLSGANY
jgi:hypothetical protein